MRTLHRKIVFAAGWVLAAHVSNYWGRRGGATPRGLCAVHRGCGFLPAPCSSPLTACWLLSCVVCNGACLMMYCFVIATAAAAAVSAAEHEVWYRVCDSHRLLRGGCLLLCSCFGCFEVLFKARAHLAHVFQPVALPLFLFYVVVLLRCHCAHCFTTFFPPHMAGAVGRAPSSPLDGLAAVSGMDTVTDYGCLAGASMRYSCALQVLQQHPPLESSWWLTCIRMHISAPTQNRSAPQLLLHKHQGSLSHLSPNRQLSRPSPPK